MECVDEGHQASPLVLDLNCIPIVIPLHTRIRVLGIRPQDVKMNKHRNEVERLFHRLKGYRRICSRYEKFNVMFIFFICFAPIANGLRSCQQTLVTSSPTANKTSNLEGH